MRASSTLVVLPSPSMTNDITRELRELSGLDSPSTDANDDKPGYDSAVPLPYVDFPLDVLPKELEDYALASSAALPANAAFVAVHLLVVLAAAVGNSFRIALKRSWTEIACLWALVIAPSGSKKSPAFRKAILPIEIMESRAFEEWKLRKERWDLERETAEAENREPDPSLEPGEPTRYRTHDTTAEAIIALHAKNPRGILVARDEQGGFLGSMDRYARGGGADMQTWIEMGEGGTVTVDRKSSDPPFITVPCANVSITGTIQPSTLREKMGASHFGTGFAMRFLMAEPPVEPGGWSEADVSPEVEEAFITLICWLYAFPQRDEPVQLSPEAKARFIAFVNENEVLMHRMPDGPLRSLLSKIEARCARFALLFHVAERGGTGEVSGEIMERAVTLAHWFRYETVRIYRRMGADEIAMSDDEKLAASLPADFDWEDVVRVAGYAGKSSAYVAIERLKKKGLIESAPGRGRWRRTAPGNEWTVDLMDRVDRMPTREPAQSIQSTQSIVHSPPEPPSQGPTPLTIGDKVETPAGIGTVTAPPLEGRVSVEVDDTPCSFSLDQVHLVS